MVNDRSWPSQGVELSIAGRQGRKIATVTKGRNRLKPDVRFRERSIRTWIKPDREAAFA